MRTFFTKLKRVTVQKSIVFFFAFFFTCTTTHAAIVSLGVESSVIKKGDRFSVDVLVDPKGVSFNSVEVSIIFPKEKIAFNGFNTQQSGIRIWVEQPKESPQGVVRFSGVIPGGVDRLYDPIHTQNTAIPVARLFFVAKDIGEASFLLSNAVILENNGKGTPISLTALGKTISVLEGVEGQQSVDTVAPTPFSVTIVDRSLFGKTPRLAVFATDDTQGGIDRYEAAIGNLGFKVVTSPMTLPYRLFSYVLTVRAFDFAGNMQEQRVVVPGERPYGVGAAVLILLFVLFIFFRIKQSKKIPTIIAGIVGVIVFAGFHTTAFASASIVLIPSQKEVDIGKQFTLSVVVRSPLQSMNAVSGTVRVSGGASIVNVGTQGSIVNFWTSEPRALGNEVHFEGIVLNPGYQGQNGKLFTITLVGRKEGVVSFETTEGALLANDGLGSNIIDTLSAVSIRVLPPTTIAYPQLPFARAEVTPGKTVALPVITEYSASVTDTGVAFLKGKGEPNALTKLSFKDVASKSLGEQFISALQTKKKKPNEALVKNDANGFFQFTSTDNLTAGVYNVTPFLVDEDTQTQKPGFGVQFLVSNSRLVRWLVVLINILILLIPVAALLVLIYFIPWYSRLRMKILRHRISIEDEQLTLSEKQLKAKETLIEKVADSETTHVVQ